MNISDSLLSNKNSEAIREIARQFNLSEEQARNAIGSLIPSVSRGLQHHSKEDIGVNDILDALNKGQHGKHLDEPERLVKKEATQEGNSILGHIFGSKDVSRNVANDAAEKTGLGRSLLKKMLPIVASMVMASLSKKVFGRGESSGGRKES